MRREADRTLLFDEVRALRDLRFGAARLPVEAGGEGIGLEELLARLVRLSAADASLGHLWRGHVAFVETLLLTGEAADPGSRWVRRVAAGALVGNAQSERQETSVLSTRLDRSGDEVTLTRHEVLHDRQHLRGLDRPRRPRRRRARHRHRGRRPPRGCARSTTGTASASCSPAAGRRPSTPSRSTRATSRRPGWTRSAGSTSARCSSSACSPSSPASRSGRWRTPWSSSGRGGAPSASRARRPRARTRSCSTWSAR